MTYVVQSGDTMSGIAAAHNMTLAALEAANPQVTDPNNIQPGLVLNIVGGRSPPAAAPPATSPSGAISIGSVNYVRDAGGGDIDYWIRRACHIMVLPPDNWVQGYRVLCARESSDQPNAINNYDSNASGPDSVGWLSAALL